MNATWEEMRFFNPLMADHGRVIRGMLDLTEDSRIREGDRFALVFAALAEQVGQAPPAAEDIAPLVAGTIPTVENFIAFKQEAQNLLEQCRIQAILPAYLVSHIRREAEWYLGMLGKPLGRPTPLRREFLLPAGETRAILLPRHLIGQVPANLNLVAMEYDLWWVHVQRDHAKIAADHTRPESQRRLHRHLSAWDTDFERLWQKGQRLFEHLYAAGHLRRPTLTPEVVRYNRELSGTLTRWRSYLMSLEEDLRRCQVPSGQTNFWPALPTHFRLETEYLLEALHRLEGAASLYAG